MKNDIEFHKPQNVDFVVGKKLEENKEFDFYVYLINNNEFNLENVIVTSKGYNVEKNQHEKTSVLRHHIEVLSAHSVACVEPLPQNLFHLVNQYWVSYYVGRKMFDKKYIFLPESFREENFGFIDALGVEGVVHS